MQQGVVYTPICPFHHLNLIRKNIEIIKDMALNLFEKIVLFKSLRNRKRRNKGNFTSKSNSNKLKLCGSILSNFK